MSKGMSRVRAMLRKDLDERLARRVQAMVIQGEDAQERANAALNRGLEIEHVGGNVFLAFWPTPARASWYDRLEARCGVRRR